MKFKNAVLDPKLQNYVKKAYKKPLSEIFTDPYLTYPDSTIEIRQKEKRIFQILNKMPNWGIGRYFTSLKLMQKYEEPSYWQITRTQVDITAPELDYGVVWGIFTWCGRCEGIEKEIRDANDQNWRLIPKMDEHLYLNYVPKSKPLKEVPLYIPVTPLLSEILKTENLKNDKNSRNKEAKVKLVVPRTKNNILRQRLPNGTLE